MTVDTSHTVLDGTESRQLLYVALTRGRGENHLYLSATEPAADDAGLPRQEPPTPLERLRAILHRNGAQECATTATREADDAAVRLHEAVLRYQDAVAFVAERGILDPDDARPGPVTWLPAVPAGLDQNWDRYLRERTNLVASLADLVALPSLAGPPAWASGLPPKLMAEVAVWRAAYGVPDSDPRPTGPRVEGRGWHHQRLLDRRISSRPRARLRPRTGPPTHRRPCGTIARTACSAAGSPTSSGIEATCPR